MLVERFAENPLIAPADVTPSRPDYEVLGTFNAGATVYNDQILLLLRVAERPADKADDEQLAPIFDPKTGKTNSLRIKLDDPDYEPIDSRVFYYKKKLYLTSISHLRIARSIDGVNFTVDTAPAVLPETDYETFGIEDPRMTTIGGVVFRYLDRLPKVGDRVVVEGLVATVLEMDGHRMARVRVAKGSAGEDEEVAKAQAVTPAAEPAEAPGQGQGEGG